MSWNLPDGCTDEDIDRAAGGYDKPEPEDPENSIPSDDLSILRRDTDIEEKDDDETDCPF